MTVAADLQARTGTQRRLVLRIDGLNYDFWQDHDVAAPSAGVDGWRTPLRCLEVEGEGGGELDVREMRASTSALEIKLRNVYDSSGNYTHLTNDPNTTYLLAQLFAPGRWTTGAETHLRKTGTESYLTPGTTTITCNNNTDFPSSGTAYIGPIAFTYTNTAGPSSGKYTFTGVTLGVYPCIGTSAYMGKSIRIDPDEEAGHTAGLAVTQYPRTLLGRRVALYVATLQASGSWSTFANSELLWCGHVDIAVGYDSGDGCWRLSCKSLLSSLEDSTIGGDMLTAGLLGINLGGPIGLDFSATIDALTGVPPTLSQYATFAASLPAAWYGTHQDLAREVAALFNDSANWTGLTNQLVVSIRYEENRYIFGAYLSGGGGWRLKIGPADGTGSGWLHPLAALGFPQYVEIRASEPVAAEFAPFEAYHPLNARCNGNTLYTSAAETPFTDQGDSSQAYLLLTNTHDTAANTGVGRQAGSRVVGYTASAYSAPRRSFTLGTPAWDTGIRAYAGTRVAGDKCEVKQCFFHADFITSKGPFETLLYPLLSTGSQDGVYNGAYDEAPPQLAVGVQDDLVDTDSFLAADRVIATEPLGARPYSLLLQSEQPWLELLQRECKLFGYFLAWSRGKLTLKRGLAPGVNEYVETLSESSNAQPIERPRIELLADHVVNSWQVKAHYDAAEDDFHDSSITINDRNSQEALRQSSSVKVEHPGLLPPWEGIAWLAAGLQQLFDGGNASRPLLAQPMQRVEISLGPAYAIRIYAGDVVRYQSDNHPDPYGSGSMSVDALGLVTSVQWNWHTWTASATLLLYAANDALSLTPWAPAATVVREAIAEGAGWNSSGDYLTLEEHDFGDSGSDNEDGQAFLEDDEILIIWTHPTDPSSGSTQGPFTVDYYDDSTDRLYLKNSPSITLTAGREYVVVFADWGSATISQKARGMWQASTTTHKLSTDQALRYG